MWGARWYGALLIALMFLPFSLAFTLTCQSPLDTTDAGTYTISVDVNATSSNLVGKVANYWLLEGNTSLAEGNVALGDPIAGDGYYIYPITFDANLPPRDANYSVRIELNVDGNVEANACVFRTYDRPRILTSPDLSVLGEGEYINAETVSIDCNDSSQCYITAVYVGDVPVVSGPVPPPVEVNLPEGSSIVQISVVDEYNNETAISYAVSVDRTPPDLGDILPESVECEEGCRYVLTLEAGDGEAGSGIADIDVFIDGEPCSVGDQCSVSPGEGAYYIYVSWLDRGEHDIYAHVCDAAGNCVNSNHAHILVIDADTYAAIDGPHISAEREQNGWYSPSALVGYVPLVDDVQVYLDGMMVEGQSFEVDEDGSHVITFRYGESEYNIFVPVDGTLPEFNWAYCLIPDIVIEVNAEDNVSGVDAVQVCLDGDCSPATDNNSAIFPLSLGEHNVEIRVWDVASNRVETNETMTIELNDLIGDLNAPALVTTPQVTVSWQPGALYAGPYTFIYDGNTVEVNGTFAELNVAAGTHRICVAVPGYSDVNRCAEFNVDVSPPVVDISAPSSTHSRNVTVSWSATDDFAVISVSLSVDGSPQTVGASGEEIIRMSRGRHTVCISAKDSAGRSSSKCVQVRVRGGGGGSSSNSRPPFPRDDIDREFQTILSSAGFRNVKINPIGEDKGQGIDEGAADAAERAEEEFGRTFAPAENDWLVRRYSVDGTTFAFVMREVPLGFDRVYEYFEEDVNIYSDYLELVMHGSTLAAFVPEDGKYSYVVASDSIGVPLREVPPPVEEEQEVEAVAEGEEQAPREEQEATEAQETNALQETTVVTPQEVNVAPVQGESAVTPFALLGVSDRSVLAGLFVVLGVLALWLAHRLEKK